MKKTVLTLIALFALPFFAFGQGPQAGRMQDFQQYRRMMDWAGFNRYAEANKVVSSAPSVIFMGDSITDNWAQMRPEFFTDHNYLGRGIGAQTVEQMLSTPSLQIMARPFVV